MSTRFTNPVPRFFDDSAVPMSGGELNFYEPGTTTRKTTYSDPELTIPNTNPVILSAGGAVPNIFLDGSYRVILTNENGDQIWDRDNVNDGTGDALGLWSPAVTYSIDNVVYASDNNYYISLVSPNLGNNPVTSPSEWAQVQFLKLDGAEAALLEDIAGLTPADSTFLVGDGATWVAETGSTARTSLGLGAGDSPTFAGLTVSGSTTTNSLVVGTQANKATISYTTNTARTLTIPNVSGNRTFAFLDQNQTFSGSQTFQSLTAGQFLAFNASDLQATVSSSTLGAGIRLTGAAAAENTVFFGSSSSPEAGRVTYSNADSSLRLWANGAERVRLTSAGDLVVGGTAYQAAGAVSLGTDGRLMANIGASGATAGASADAVVVQRAADTGVSILTPDASTSRVVFGSPGNTSGGELRWRHDDNLLTLGTNKVGASVAIRADNNVLGLTLAGSAGNQVATFPGDIDASAGGVFLGGTSAVNYLAAYVSGVFSPTVADAATGGNTAPGYDLRVGRYTRVGSLVTVYVSLLLSDTTGMTLGNTLWVRDLPFPADANTLTFGLQVLPGTTSPVAVASVNLLAGATGFQLFNHTTSAAITVGDVADTDRIVGIFSYFTS